MYEYENGKIDRVIIGCSPGFAISTIINIKRVSYKQAVRMYFWLTHFDLKIDSKS